MKNYLLLLLLIATFSASAQIQTINVSTPNSGAGDPLRTAFIKTNDNFAYLDFKASASGTNTYTATPSPALTSYVTGQVINVTFANANTSSSVTLDISSLGAKNIYKTGSVALVAGDIKAGQTVPLYYGGTDFQILGDGANIPASDVPFTAGGTIASTNVQDAIAEVDTEKVPTTRLINSQPLSSDITLTKSNIGLSNVDNTSDVNKPVSTAQATADALNLKIASNLSDINNASTARTNLGLGTLATLAAAPAGTLTGTTLNSTVVTTSITSTGTLTGGATGAGFTVALATSTITGALPVANLTAKYILDQVSASTASSTITLDMNSQIQRMFLGSATFATGKVMALSNTTNSLVFNFQFEITNVAATVTLPTGWTMSDTKFASPIWTATSTGKYEMGGTFDGTNWKVKIVGPFL